MESHHYLFLIADGVLRTWLRRSHDRFDLVRFNGSEHYPLENNSAPFWDWWKETISYTTSDLVDFVLLSDNLYDAVMFLPDGFIAAEKSLWTLQDVEICLSSVYQNSKIRLRENDLSQDYLADIRNRHSKPEKTLNIVTFPQRQLLEKSEIFSEAEQEPKILFPSGGAISDYYREETQKIQEKLKKR
jgi:hypothetical protein